MVLWVFVSLVFLAETGWILAVGEAENYCRMKRFCREETRKEGRAELMHIQGEVWVVACSLCPLQKKKITAVYLPLPSLLTNDVWRSDSRLCCCCCQPRHTACSWIHLKGREGQIITSKIYAHIYIICWGKCANLCIQHTATVAHQINLLGMDDVSYSTEIAVFSFNAEKRSSPCEMAAM